MTIEEKMEHFREVSLDNVSTKSHNILVEYKKSLDEQFEKHKQSALEDAKEAEASQISAVKVEAKRALSKLQSEIKRDVIMHQNELKTELFDAVNAKIYEYKTTDEYKKMLIDQIKKIQKDFDDAEIDFFIDPSDEMLLDSLIKATAANIQINQTAFIGGIKAIVNSKNILVDNSFKTKLSEEQEKFTISI